MTAEFRDALHLFVLIVLAVIGYLLRDKLATIHTDTKETKKDVKELAAKVSGHGERLVRIETKISKTPEPTPPYQWSRP